MFYPLVLMIISHPTCQNSDDYYEDQDELDEVVNAEHYEPRVEDKPAVRKYFFSTIDYQTHPYQVCFH